MVNVSDKFELPKINVYRVSVLYFVIYCNYAIKMKRSYI